MPNTGNYVRRESIIKRSLAYAVTITTVTAAVTILLLSYQNIITKFIDYQFQIIAIATIILALALFVQYRETSDSTSNAKLHHELEKTYHALADKNQEIYRQKHEIELDLHTALMVQKAIINRFSPDTTDIDVGCHYEPATNVGGDFYTFPQSGPGNFDLVIGDVAGHGVPSSLVTILSLVLISELAKEPLTCAQILIRANSQITDYLRATTVPFVTALYGRYVSKDQRFHYSLAGHPHPLLKRNGNWRELKGTGVLLGVYDNNIYEDQQIQLQPGDLLVFYTDGLTETKDEQGNLFGAERLKDTIDDARSSEPGAIIKHVFKTIKKLDEAQAQDDRSLIVLAF